MPKTFFIIPALTKRSRWLIFVINQQQIYKDASNFKKTKKWCLFKIKINPLWIEITKSKSTRKKI